MNRKFLTPGKKQLQTEVIVFLIGNLTETGGVQLSSEFVADLQSLHQYRKIMVCGGAAMAEEKEDQISHTVFIVEDPLSYDNFHLDEEINLLVCNDAIVSDYFIN